MATSFVLYKMWCLRTRESTIRDLMLSPGADVIALRLDDKLPALFHMACSITMGIVVMPESLGETEREAELQLGVSPTLK